MEEKVISILDDYNEAIKNYEGENMVADGLVDSFELIGIVGDLEEEFDIEIDAKYVVTKYFANKDAIIALVKQLVG